MATSSKNSNPAQDIYLVPKLIRKKRKHAQAVQPQTSGEATDELQELVEEITHHQIKTLDANLKAKVYGRHLNLKKTPPQQENKTQPAGEYVNNSHISRRRNYMDLSYLIKMEQRSYRYDDFLKLHSMWLGYMYELLELGPSDTVIDEKSAAVKQPAGRTALSLERKASSAQARLLKADFHGAILQVSRAKNPALVGLTGIVIQETKSCFRLINSLDEVKLVPKVHAIFQVTIPLNTDLHSQVQKGESSSTPESDITKTMLVFKIFGSAFNYRAADRVNRKFKFKSNVEL